MYFLHSLLDAFLITVEPSPMNMAKGSIRIFPKLKEKEWKMAFKYFG